MMAGVTGSSTLAFHRPPGVWRDILRKYRLVVDGRVLGEIRRDQVVRLSVSPGRHQVQAMIDWAGSPPVIVDLPAGAEARFRVEPAGNSFMVWQMLGATTYLRLTFEGMVEAAARPGIASSAGPTA